MKYTCNILRSMNVNNNCLQKSETKINQFYFLLLQIVLLTIVLLAAFGNDGIRLTFGRADFLGVGISVTLAITLPLTFIAYLCGGNLFVLVSFILVIIPFKCYHENESCELSLYESIVSNVLNAGGKLTKRHQALEGFYFSEKSPDFLSLQVQFDVTALKLDTFKRGQEDKSIKSLLTKWHAILINTLKLWLWKNAFIEIAIFICIHNRITLNLVTNSPQPTILEK